MAGFQAIAHTVTQIGSLVVGITGVVLVVRSWNSDTWIDSFGRCLATPLARTCDALIWAPRQFEKQQPGRSFGAAAHRTITAFFPIAAVVFTNGSAVDQAPVAFGLAGVIAGVIAEAPRRSRVMPNTGAPGAAPKRRSPQFGPGASNAFGSSLPMRRSQQLRFRSRWPRH